MNNHEKRGILIGLVIGDGSIQRHQSGYSYYLQITHGMPQQEYLKYKANLIGAALECRPPKLYYNDGHATTFKKPSIRISKAHKYFKILRKWMYKDKKKTYKKTLKWLTPHGLALWYMDDGCLTYQHRNGRIKARQLVLCTYTSRDETEFIQSFFKDKFNISFKINRHYQYYRLRCGTHESKKFLKIVDPYIIDSMRYKIDLKYKPQHLTLPISWEDEEIVQSLAKAQI